MQGAMRPVTAGRPGRGSQGLAWPERGPDGSGGAGLAPQASFRSAGRGTLLHGQAGMDGECVWVGMGMPRLAWEAGRGRFAVCWPRSSVARPVRTGEVSRRRARVWPDRRARAWPVCLGHARHGLLGLVGPVCRGEARWGQDCPCPLWYGTAGSVWSARLGTRGLPCGPGAGWVLLGVAGPVCHGVGRLGSKGCARRHWPGGAGTVGFGKQAGARPGMLGRSMDGLAGLARAGMVRRGPHRTAGWRMAGMVRAGDAWRGEARTVASRSGVAIRRWLGGAGTVGLAWGSWLGRSRRARQCKAGA